jgi:hypothetical protein
LRWTDGFFAALSAASMLAQSVLVGCEPGDWSGDQRHSLDYRIASLALGDTCSYFDASRSWP